MRIIRCIATVSILGSGGNQDSIVTYVSPTPLERSPSEAQKCADSKYGAALIKGYLRTTLCNCLISFAYAQSRCDDAYLGAWGGGGVLRRS